MENLTASGLRSRSRSKTPFLRSNCDGENCNDEEHTHHKSGRKTPIRRSTPVKQLEHQQTTRTVTREIITEEAEQFTSPPAHRTRHSTRAAGNLIKTSDYSSEESLDRLKGSHGDTIQRDNTHNERVSASNRYTLEDATLSPITYGHTSASFNVNSRRSSRIGSPTYSACSTDSSFAEQALADTSVLLEINPEREHLPFRLYKMAGEYWNKYPKTDFLYSTASKDRVELAPGQVAMPNMSRRSLTQFRIQGPNTSPDELDYRSTTTTTTNTMRKRYTSVDSSDDEGSYVRGNGMSIKKDDRWWITRVLVAIINTVTTTTTSAYRTVVGPPHRYPYTERTQAKASIPARVASAAVSPFVWIYTMMKSVVTTTVTTVTETVSPNHVSEKQKYIGRSYQQRKVAKRSWWPWILLLLLPAIGYGSHYTYENWEHLTMPNFTDFKLNLSEFTNLEMPQIIPKNLNILPKMDLTLPDIKINLPDITDNLPEVRKTYREYRDIVQDRMVDASDYMKVVANSCYEEMRRFWSGVIG